jgi:hypothetical protein
VHEAHVNVRLLDDLNEEAGNKLTCDFKIMSYLA